MIPLSRVAVTALVEYQILRIPVTNSGDIYNSGDLINSGDTYYNLGPLEKPPGNESGISGVLGP
jgi:hypothetical protein